MHWGLRSVGILVLVCSPVDTRATTWTLGLSGSEDFATLREACAAAAPGDSILINPGYYDESASWIDLNSKPLSLIGLGASPDDTALKLRLNITDCAGCLFRNLCIRDGEDTSVYSSGSQATFSGCTVRDNRGPAIRVVDLWELTLEDCVLSGNRIESDYGTGGALMGCFTVRRSLFLNNAAGQEGGAIWAENGSVIEECVFFGNEAPTGAALNFAGDVQVRECTFLANRVTGMYGGAVAASNTYDDPISHCIISGTVNGYGVSCAVGLASMECCDLWNNDLGDYWEWYCDASPENGNIFVDPLFCDPATGDVGLLPGSPCLPGNHGGMECGLIGAKDVGCGLVAVERVTWGRLKALYREGDR